VRLQELVHQRHLREDRHRGGQAGALQQEADGHQPRDPDRRAPHPAGRAGQARRVRGHQGRHQVHLLVERDARPQAATRAAPHAHHHLVLFNTTSTHARRLAVLQAARARLGRPAQAQSAIFSLRLLPLARHACAAACRASAATLRVLRRRGAVSLRRR
jgi:hypothetical protein